MAHTMTLNYPSQYHPIQSITSTSTSTSQPSYIYFSHLHSCPYIPPATVSLPYLHTYCAPQILVSYHLTTAPWTQCLTQPRLRVTHPTTKESDSRDRPSRQRLALTVRKGQKVHGLY